VSNATNQRLDRLAGALQADGGTGTDYALAKALGVSRAAVSRWRHGLNLMDEDTAIRISETLGDDPCEFLAELSAERSKSAGAKEHWSRIAKMLKAEGRHAVAA